MKENSSSSDETSFRPKRQQPCRVLFSSLFYFNFRDRKKEGEVVHIILPAEIIQILCVHRFWLIINSLYTSTLNLSRFSWCKFLMLPAVASDKETWNPGCVCVDPLDAVYVNVTKLKVETTSSGNIDPQ